ncbi:MAG: DUF4856 domain-containing protein [Aureispira sp.]
MNNIKNFTTNLLAVSLVLTACQKEINQDYSIPTTYNFANVDYSGQTERVIMLKELATYAKSANTPNQPQLSAATMEAMYENNTTNGNPFSNPALATSTKQIKNKVEASTQAAYSSYMIALENASQYTNMVASAGQAGIGTDNNGNTYLFNANGLELAQLIEKGLATSCMYYQSVNIYLGPTKMNVDNQAVIDGKGTNMEHHWDEAFGYFGAPIDFPANTTNLDLWAKYSNKVSPTIGSNTKIMNAFLEGRAAISAEDYDARDRMIDVVREEWELILAAVAISYFNDAKDAGSDMAACYHYLTEAYAFAMGIQYGPNPKINTADLNTILENLAGSANPLNANLYNVTIPKIDAAINSLAAIYTELESVKASL